MAMVDMIELSGTIYQDHRLLLHLRHLLLLVMEIIIQVESKMADFLRLEIMSLDQLDPMVTVLVTIDLWTLADRMRFEYKRDNSCHRYKRALFFLPFTSTQMEFVVFSSLLSNRVTHFDISFLSIPLLSIAIQSLLCTE